MSNTTNNVNVSGQIAQTGNDAVRPQTNTTVKLTREELRQHVSMLRKDPAAAIAILDNETLRTAKLYDERPLGVMAIATHLAAALHVLATKKLREIEPQNNRRYKTLGELAIISHPDAALIALKDPDIYMVKIKVEGKFREHLAHIAVKRSTPAAKYALTVEAFSDLKDNAGFSVWDYAGKRLKEDERLDSMLRRLRESEAMRARSTGRPTRSYQKR